MNEKHTLVQRVRTTEGRNNNHVLIYSGHGNQHEPLPVSYASYCLINGFYECSVSFMSPANTQRCHNVLTLNTLWRCKDLVLPRSGSDELLSQRIIHCSVLLLSYLIFKMLQQRFTSPSDGEKVVLPVAPHTTTLLEPTA